MNGLHIVPSAQNDGDQRTSSTDCSPLRSKIVEILSNTANGCLSELGYYPGMSQKMQELEKQNAEWQSENVKLFQDNRNLSRALHSQAEQSKHTIFSLEKKIQELNENALLTKQNEASQPGPPDIAYQQLLAEYRRLYAYYSAARIEIKQLREYIDHITGGQRSHSTHSPVNSTAGQSSISSPSPHNIETRIVNQPVQQHAGYLPGSPTRPTTATSAQQPVNQDGANGHHTHESKGTVQEFPVLPQGRSHGTTPLGPTASVSPLHPHPASSNQATPPPDRVVASPLPANVYGTPGPPQGVLPGSGSSPKQPSSIPPPDKVVVSPLPADVYGTPGPPQGVLPGSGSSPKQPSPIPPTMSVPPTSPVSILPEAQLSEPRSLKRGNEDIADAEGEPSKKLRIENQMDIEEPKDDEEESDSEAEAIDVGSDGLRLVEDCVAALIDDDEEAEGVQHCKLCVARYSMGYTSDPPQPFVRATIDQLVSHCSSEHEDAWNTLRQVS